jgi:large subunit ribosomal protein L18
MAFQRAEKRTTRRARVRRKVRGDNTRPRLSVYRSLHHIYVQVISDESGRTLAAASTAGKEAASTAGKEVDSAEAKSKRGVGAARVVGKLIAERCREAGIGEVVFDRNGFLYHGRVKALADAAREAGLRF